LAFPHREPPLVIFRGRRILPMPIHSLFFLVILFTSRLPVFADETLQGRFVVDLEPVAAMEPGVPYPLDQQAAARRIFEEAAVDFAAMIYGWSFLYEPGDKARQIEEFFELKPLGNIPWGDPRLTALDTHSEGSKLYVWVEYRPDEIQRRYLAAGREGSAKTAQGTGSALVSLGVRGKSDALEDAAREALRGMLRGSERNKPKEARGTLVLSEIPRFWVDAGHFSCAARFRVVVKEVVPFRVF